MADIIGPNQLVGYRGNLKDEAANAVRLRIFRGKLRPRDKIDQDALAAALGISKQPVREAMILLQSEGLVQLVARRGAFVADLTPEDITDHFLIFGMLAGLATERSAARLTDDDVEDLSKLVAKMADVVDVTDYADLNHRFHRRINMACGSRRLLSAMRSLANTIPEDVLIRSPDWISRGHADHEDILRALQAKDAAAAGKAMERHLFNGGLEAVSGLRELAFWD